MPALPPTSCLLPNLFFLIESHSIAQGGVQWCHLGSLQPHLPGSSNSPALALQVAGINRHVPPCSANFFGVCIFETEACGVTVGLQWHNHG